jgi:uncharacterized membrane protein YtjA (UPF0391 family)
MLRWALAFFVVALVAAIFGFLGIAVAAAGIARILFFISWFCFLFRSLAGWFAGPTSDREPSAAHAGRSRSALNVCSEGMI